MKTAAEFRRSLITGQVPLRESWREFHAFMDELLDVLAAREAQVKRLVEAGKALLAKVDEGMLTNLTSVENSEYLSSEKEEDALHAAIAAVENEGKEGTVRT